MESHGHDMAEKTENGEGLRRKRGGTAVQLLWVMVSCWWRGALERLTRSSKSVQKISRIGNPIEESWRSPFTNLWNLYEYLKSSEYLISIETYWNIYWPLLIPFPSTGSFSTEVGGFDESGLPLDTTEPDSQWIPKWSIPPVLSRKKLMNDELNDYEWLNDNGEREIMNDSVCIVFVIYLLYFYFWTSHSMS
jgi:hypothetical protein